jgi:hypothetical protein
VRLVVPLGLAIASCVLDEVSLERAKCPCVEGWVCDVARGECVRAGGLDAAVDAGRDAGADANVREPDAGSIDAAMPDAGAPDAGSDPSACDDSLAGAIFCDGFEGDSLVPPWTAMLEVTGSASLDPMAYRGRGALLANTPMGPSRGAVIFAAEEAGGEGVEIHGRAYYYIPSGPVLTRVTGMLFIEPGDPLEAVGVGPQFGTTFYVYVGPARMAIASPAAAPVPRDRWFCVQFRMVTGVMGEVEMAVDGTTVVVAKGINTLPMGGIQNLEVGIEYATSTQEAISLYVDEVAVGFAPLPCD